MTRHRWLRVVVSQRGSGNVTTLPADCQKPLALDAYSATPPLGAVPSSQTRHRRSLSDWVREISEAWALGASNTLHLARLVSQARQSLQYGEWSQLWRSRQVFSKRKGEMLVTIGQALGRLDAQTSAQLPPAWNAVYYLARLGRSTVERLIAQGRIHPGLTLREARALLAEQKPGMIQSACRSTVKRRLDRLAAFVRETMATWTAEERQLAHVALLRLAEQVEPEGESPTVTANQAGFQPALSGSCSTNCIHTFPPIHIHSKHSMA